MSRENVEIIRQLQPGPEVDFMELFWRDADPAEIEAGIAEAAPAFTDDFVCVFHALSGEPRPGVQGLREGWLDWLEPWTSYRAEIQEIIDAGDHVVVLVRDYARRPGLGREVELHGTTVWTLREGKIARAEFFATDRDAAFAAAGLPEAQRGRQAEDFDELPPR